MIGPAGRCRLGVLGSALLERSDGVSVHSVLTQPRRIALLTYLTLVRPGEFVSRDAITAAFWPDSDDTRARNALRQGIHFLRRSLGATAIEARGDHAVRVSDSVVTCDAIEFDELMAARRFEDALGRFRGGFLDDVPLTGMADIEDWADRKRHHYRQNALAAMLELHRTALREGRQVSAVDWARRALDLDPLCADAAIALIDTLGEAGDAVAAVQTYEAYRDRLRGELELEPPDKVRRSVDGWRRATVHVDPPVTVTNPPAPALMPPDTPGIPSVASLERGERADGAVEVPGRISRRRRAASLRVPLGVAAAVLLTLGPAPSPAIPAGTTSGPAVRHSVAVLPFVNRSTNPDNAFFAAGVHENVVLLLSRAASIDVTSRRAVEGYVNDDRPLRTIADELSVTSVLSGSVQREDDQIRIMVELIDPESGAQLWSDVYDRRLDDVFEVQSAIASEVAHALRAVLTADELDDIVRPPTHSIAALDAYLRGRAAYLALDPQRMEEAIAHFRRALELDSSYAAAWAALGDAVLQQAQFFGYPVTWADSGRAMAERALSLDPDLPEARKTLGFAYVVQGRLRDALRETERALALHPSFADALNNAGWLHYMLGDLDRAESYIQRSFRLQPTVLQIRSNVGAIWAILGRTEEATDWLDGVLAIDPTLPVARLWRTMLDVQVGRPGDALDRAERDLEDDPSPAGAFARAAFAASLVGAHGKAAAYADRAHAMAPGVDLFDLRGVDIMRGIAYAALGHEAEAHDLLETAIARLQRERAAGADGWDLDWELASAYAGLQDAERALRFLDAAVTGGFPFATLLRLDPAFAFLRADPRFVSLVERARQKVADGAAVDSDRLLVLAVCQAANHDGVVEAGRDARKQPRQLAGRR